MVVRERLLMKKIKKREEKKRELSKKNKPQPEADNTVGKFWLATIPHFALTTCSHPQTPMTLKSRRKLRRSRHP